MQVRFSYLAEKKIQQLDGEPSSLVSKSPDLQISIAL